MAEMSRRQLQHWYSYHTLISTAGSYDSTNQHLKIIFCYSSHQLLFSLFMLLVIFNYYDNITFYTKNIIFELDIGSKLKYYFTTH